MTIPRNGVLFIDNFTPTATPGEYEFTNGVFNSQTDPNGDGAFMLAVGFVLYIPISDSNTFFGMPGVVSRFKLTSLTIHNSSQVSGVLLFDDDGTEVGFPTNSSFCLISETTPNKKIGIPPLDDIYIDLVKGGTIASMLRDLINILDKTSASIPDPEADIDITIDTNGQTSFTLPYSPITPERRRLYLNGLLYRQGINNDYTITGNSLQWLNSSVPLETSFSLVLI